MMALYYFNGKKLQSGVVAGDKTRLTTLSKAMRSQYFVYSLRWTKKELVWYVNNMEVLRMENTLSAEELFFLAQSFSPKKNRAGKASMKVQWIRVYKAAE